MSNIPFSFLLPIVSIIFGTCISAIMAVPETPVYKYRYLFIEKNKIRMSLYTIIPTPPSNLILLKDLNKPQFRGFITRALTFRIISERSFWSNMSLNARHLSNSIRRLGSVSAVRIISLYLSTMSAIVELRFPSSNKLCS